MGGSLRPRGRTILPLLLSLSVGCSRPAGVRSGAETTQPTAPFRDVDDPNPRPGLSSVASERPRFENPDVQSLPVGTLLTVRLKDPIHSDPPGANGTFIALVDEPIVIEGATVVPRGASVAGRIESARSSTMKHNHGYVRLTLDLVDIEGKEVPIRTSSLFARGIAVDHQGRTASEMVSLEQGRRLTFRLSEALNVLAQGPDTPR